MPTLIVNRQTLIEPVNGLGNTFCAHNLTKKIITGVKNRWESK